MIRRPPRSTRTEHSFPTRRSSDLASAVQFTRQTQGLASALKKVGGVAEGSRLISDQAEQVSHMLFGDGVGYSSFFSSHPPLIDSTKALAPAFVAAQLPQLKKPSQPTLPAGVSKHRPMGSAEARAERHAG